MPDIPISICKLFPFGHDCIIVLISHLVERLQEDGTMLIHVQHTDVGLQIGGETHRVRENGCSA